MRYFYFLLFLPFVSYGQGSPCDGTFDMIFENSVTICEDQNYIITPSTTDLDSFAWFDGSHIIPRTFSSTGQYVFQGFIHVEDLIINGDFENSNTGFTSDYIQNQTTIWNEGTYAITPDVSIQHPNLISFGHGGTGSFMAVNGTGVANTEVWCQEVTVVPNTIYEFSAWVTSTSPSNPATLQFSVNGNLLSTPFNASATVNSWNQFFATWNSGSNTLVEICVVNQNTILSGNDFGLDDISFFRQCDSTELLDTFNLTVLPYADASIIDHEPVCESSDPVQILVQNNGGVWTGNGISHQVLGFFDPSVVGPGEYDLTYTFTDPCGDEQTTTIEVIPDVELGIDTSVCEIDSNFIISVKSDTTGFWSSTNVSNAGVFSPSDAGPGQHIVSYSNVACTDDREIQVDEYPEIDFPVLEACEGSESVIFYLDSIYDEYIWYDGTKSIKKEIDKPGTYSLLVINGECEREFTFYVENACVPDVYYPNTFSPNGDGLNDDFFPTLIAVDETNINLKVYNRWGMLLHHSKSVDNPWLGTNMKGQSVQQGMYIFTFEYGYWIKNQYEVKVDNGLINVVY